MPAGPRIAILAPTAAAAAAAARLWKGRPFIDCCYCFMLRGLVLALPLLQSVSSSFPTSMVTPPDGDRLPTRLEVTCPPVPDSMVPTPRALVSCVWNRRCVQLMGPLHPVPPADLRKGFPLRLESCVLCTIHGDTLTKTPMLAISQLRCIRHLFQRQHRAKDLGLISRLIALLKSLRLKVLLCLKVSLSRKKQPGISMLAS